MKDYAELERRLRDLDWYNATDSMRFEAADAISDLTKRLEEAGSVHSHTHQVAREEWAVRLRHEVTVRDRLLAEILHWIDTAEFDDGSPTNCPVSAIVPTGVRNRIATMIRPNLLSRDLAEDKEK